MCNVCLYSGNAAVCTEQVYVPVCVCTVRICVYTVCVYVCVYMLYTCLETMYVHEGV